MATPANDPTPPLCMRAPTCLGRSAISAKEDTGLSLAGDVAAGLELLWFQPGVAGPGVAGAASRQLSSAFPWPIPPMRSCHPDGSWLVSGQSLACNALVAGAAQALAGWLPVILQMAAVM